MKRTTLPTLIEMRGFVAGCSSFELAAEDKSEIYGWIAILLAGVRYSRQGKADRGTVRSFICAVTGYSVSQTTRLIRSYTKTGSIMRLPSKRSQFTVKYTKADITALVELDNAHDRLAGPAVLKLCKRASEVFADERYTKLSNISVSHIYNLRQRPGYIRQSLTFTRTQSTTVAIGVRHKPAPDGRAGYIRVDTVHQGDNDKTKGVYHVNLVDEVTQWEVVVAVEKISELYMIPALEAAMNQFPFIIIEFHADNGSEYINHKVAELLNRMKIKLSKSRAYHSGDNGLVETKNGSIVRKALGYSHIPGIYAPIINEWYDQWFIPYLNYHRPCGFRKTVIDPKTGKQKHSYPKNDYQTPYEKLKSLPEEMRAMKGDPDATIMKSVAQIDEEYSPFTELDLIAYAMSDTAWIIATNKAKYRMLTTINKLIQTANGKNDT